MRLPPPFAPRSQILVLLATLLLGCSPTFVAHYASKPFADIRPSKFCGIASGINVFTEPPATCPDLAAVSQTAAAVVRVARKAGYAADMSYLDGASLVYVEASIDCSDSGRIVRARFVRGCTLGDYSAVQTGGPLSIGFAYEVTRHELAHALLFRLGMGDEDREDAFGTHYPRGFWRAIDHGPDESFDVPRLGAD